MIQHRQPRKSNCCHAVANCASASLTSSSPCEACAMPSAFLLLLSNFLSRFSCLTLNLSSSPSTGGLSSTAGPHGASISTTTCRICRLTGKHCAILMVSPWRRDELGSETMWNWSWRKCYLVDGGLVRRYLWRIKGAEVAHFLEK